MREIKPTFKMAQQISRRHTVISLVTTISVLVPVLLVTLLVLRIIGFQHPVTTSWQFFKQYHLHFISYLIFFHFVPVNFYAIKRVFSAKFKAFELKVYAKENSDIA